MSNKTIILITASYPYGKGEQFLETELHYLSNRFDRIIVLPQVSTGFRRMIPDKVLVDLLLIRPKNRLIYLAETFIRGITAPYFYIEIVNKSELLNDPRKLIRIIQYIGNAIRVRNRIRLYIREANINLSSTAFYTYWVSSASLGIGLIKLIFPNIKLISRAHGGDIYEKEHSPEYIPFKKLTIDNIDRIFCVSEHGKRYLSNQFPSIVNRCIVSKLGVDDPGVMSSSSPANSFCLVSCSSLIPRKRVHLIIQGLASLIRTNPKLIIEWHHFGEGPLRDHIEKLAHDTLPHTIKWYFYGQISNAELYGFYKTHPVDVFINVSNSEGIPVSIMEAMCFGIPVIATNVGGMPEIVNDQNGILMVNNPSAEDISSALLTLANDKSMYRRLASKQTWQSMYNAGKNYNEFADRIDQIIADNIY